jgi:hypothetical protein
MVKPPVKSIHYIAAVSLLIVFLIDVLTPTEFIADILYLCCILIVFQENAGTIIRFGVIACLLIIIDVVFVDLKLKLSVAHYINRGMSIIVILVTAYMAMRYRKLSDAGIIKEQKNLQAIEEILFITSHQVRKPVANILGLIDTINCEDTTISITALKEHCEYLSSSATELDNYIKQLNAFIEHAGHEIDKDDLMQVEIKVTKETLHKVYHGFRNSNKKLRRLRTRIALHLIL